MNLARTAENLGVSNLGHFDSELEALWSTGADLDGDGRRDGLSSLRTGLETLEAGILQLSGPLLSPAPSIKETPLLVVPALRADMNRPVEQIQDRCSEDKQRGADVPRTPGSSRSNVVAATNFREGG